MSTKYVFGVDIGGTTVKMGLFTAEGSLVNKFEIETRKADNGSRILPDIAEAIRKKLEEDKIGWISWQKSWGQHCPTYPA